MKLYTLLMLLFFSVFSQAQGQSPDTKSRTTTAEDERALKEVVEKFLKAAGSNDVATMRTLFLAKANIGGQSFKEGKWTSYTMTADEWFERIAKNTNAKPYTEPVSNYTIHISESRLAFVQANAVLHRDGQPQAHNMDYFVLMKENGQWKFLSGAYTSVPVK